jgi:hypothetical protein
VKATVTAAAAAAITLAASLARAQLPVPDHVLIVVLENHDFEQIIGAEDAPYINSLAADGALFAGSHAITHPSQPNYLWLFSGSDQGVTTNECPLTFSSENLGHLLLAASLGFAGYSEDLPAEGSTVCFSGQYVRRHSPWVDFSNVPASANKPFTAFPSQYGTLPTVSFVIPNQQHNMHDGSVSAGDTWLRQHVGGFVRWAFANNSLLVLTFDEDDVSIDNHIATVFIGPMVQPGSFGETIDHVDVLRTIEDMYGLPHAGASGVATPITDVWNGCGNGVADGGEQCGEPGLACGAGETCHACTCVNATICHSGRVLGEPSLTMTADPFVMRLKGEASIPKPWIGVDPQSNGIHFEVDEPGGAGGLDVVIPGGARWHVNSKKTKWKYLDPVGTIAGVTKVVVTDETRHEDELEIIVKAKGGIAVLPHPTEARMAVVFGTDDECAAAAFDGFPASCSGHGARIKCR